MGLCHTVGFKLDELGIDEDCPKIVVSLLK